MAPDTSQNIGELLVRKNVISPGELEEAKKQVDEDGSRLGYELTKLGFVEEDELTALLSKHHGVPAVDLENVDVPEEVLKFIPRDMAVHHQCLPINRSGETLVVAMADPSNIYAIDDLKFLTDFDIEVVVASESAIQEAIGEYYKGADTEQLNAEYDDIIDDVELDTVEVKEKEEQDDVVDLKQLQNETESPPVVRLVNVILMKAVDDEASDIHIEPYENDFRVRFRVDGVLKEVMRPPAELKSALVSRIKVMADLDIAERRLPQDGRMKVRIGADREMDFRVSVMPVTHGEKVVLRLLDKSNLQLDMRKLGFEEDDLEVFQRNIYEPHGICLVTGPTGSGKTTTLYSAISELNTPEENISTAEDPVEFNLEGINQVHVKSSIGLTFASALRSFLRQDPDIILVGEIRDLETAEIAVEAALTGHLVLSTLHTNSAPGTVSRLLNMGIEPFMLTSALSVIVAQRLARRICKNCKEPLDIKKEALRDMGVPEDQLDTTVYHGVGCSECDDSGYSGRVAFFEILEVNEDFKEHILEGCSTAELKHYAVEQGMNTLRQAGINKMLEGITTPEEVMRNTARDS